MQTEVTETMQRIVIQHLFYGGGAIPYPIIFLMFNIITYTELDKVCSKCSFEAYFTLDLRFSQI